MIAAVAYVLKYFDGDKQPAVSTSSEMIVGCLITFLINTNTMVSCFSTPTPPGKDRRYYSMNRSDGRVFCYLTTNIVVATWTYSVLSCYAVFTEDARFQEATHRFCPFFTSLSIIFVLLYLNFNWFNKTFVQETFMGLKDLKTVTRFSQLSLLGHVPAFSGALLDVSLAKDSDTLMRTQPSLRHLVILNLVVALSYLTLAHHNFYRTRGWWPYVVVVLIRCPLPSLTKTTNYRYAFCDKLYYGIPQDKNSPIWKLQPSERGSLKKELKFIIVLLCAFALVQFVTVTAIGTFLSGSM